MTKHIKRHHCVTLTLTVKYVTIMFKKKIKTQKEALTNISRLRTFYSYPHTCPGGM